MANSKCVKPNSSENETMRESKYKFEPHLAKANESMKTLPRIIIGKPSQFNK